MQRRFAIAAFVLVGAITGCAGDGRPPPPVERVARGRFEMTMRANAPGRTATLHASGAFDVDTDRYSLVTNASGFAAGLDGSTSIVATPDAVFVDCPYLTRMLGAPTRWIMVRGAAGDLFRSSILDQLVRPTTMRFSDAPEDGGVVLSIDYFDVGAPVVIEPPAAEELTDETDAVDRLFGGRTGG